MVWPVLFKYQYLCQKAEEIVTSDFRLKKIAEGNLDLGPSFCIQNLAGTIGKLWTKSQLDNGIASLVSWLC